MTDVEYRVEGTECMSNSVAVLVHVDNIPGAISRSLKVHSCLCGQEIPYFYKNQRFIAVLTIETYYYP
jgi:hypothetical protein